MLSKEEIELRAKNIIEREIFCLAPYELIEHLRNIDQHLNDLYCVPDFTDSEAGCFQEPLEFYLVSKWLGEVLKKYYEPATELSTCYVWGRCTSGQAIIYDGTFQKLVEVLNKDEDQ